MKWDHNTEDAEMLPNYKLSRELALAYLLVNFCHYRNLWHVPYYYKPLPNIVVSNLAGTSRLLGQQWNIHVVTIGPLLSLRADNEIPT